MKSNSWQLSVRSVTLCIAAFVFVNILIFRKTWLLDEWQQFAALGIPCAQVALVTLVATFAPKFLWLRVISVPVAGVISWFVSLRICSVMVAQEDSAVLMILLTSQTVLIAAVAKLAKRWIDRSLAEPDEIHRPALVAFDLQTLLLGTVGVACLFAVGRYGSANWNWNLGDDVVTRCWIAVAFGVSNAASVAAFLWAVYARSLRRAIVRVVIVAMLLPAIWSASTVFANWISQREYYPISPAMLHASFTAIVLTTLAICLRRSLTDDDADLTTGKQLQDGLKSDAIELPATGQK